MGEYKYSKQKKMHAQAEVSNKPEDRKESIYLLSDVYDWSRRYFIWYCVRFGFFCVIMFAVLCVAHTTEGLVYYFCTAYLDVQMDEDDKTVDWYDQEDA